MVAVTQFSLFGAEAAPPALPLRIFRYTHRLIVAMVGASTASTLQQIHLHHPEHTL